MLVCQANHSREGRDSKGDDQVSDSRRWRILRFERRRMSVLITDSCWGAIRLGLSTTVELKKKTRSLRPESGSILDRRKGRAERHSANPTPHTWRSSHFITSDERRSFPLTEKTAGNAKKNSPGWAKSAAPNVTRYLKWSSECIGSWSGL